MNESQPPTHSHSHPHEVLSDSLVVSSVLNMSGGIDDDITGILYKCHLCSWTGPSKMDYKAHMNTHFDHHCPNCDYASRTEGRLKAHIRNFHTTVAPPEAQSLASPTSTTFGLEPHHMSDDDNHGHDDDEDSNGGDDYDITSASGDLLSGGVKTDAALGKPRKFRCKQCDFVSMEQAVFWDHTREHIKPEKLMSCQHCTFVTEFKHHLEYHLRRHLDFKPFQCPKCNYSCVNKSMLNSHMKSHSNVYQYRCRDCAYATKYCHSLKLHLRKYGHEPAEVLNLDGTPNPYPIIDVYGTRRGPRPKRDKSGALIPLKAGETAGSSRSRKPRPSKSRAAKAAAAATASTASTSATNLSETASSSGIGGEMGGLNLSASSDLDVESHDGGGEGASERNTGSRSSGHNELGIGEAGNMMLPMGGPPMSPLSPMSPMNHGHVGMPNMAALAGLAAHVGGAGNGLVPAMNGLTGLNGGMDPTQLAFAAAALQTSFFGASPIHAFNVLHSIQQLQQLAAILGPHLAGVAMAGAGGAGGMEMSGSDASSKLEMGEVIRERHGHHAGERMPRGPVDLSGGGKRHHHSSSSTGHSI